MELSSHLDFEKIAIKATLHGKNIAKRRQKKQRIPANARAQTTAAAIVKKLN